MSYQPKTYWNRDLAAPAFFGTCVSCGRLTGPFDAYAKVRHKCEPCQEEHRKMIAALRPPGRYHKYP